MTGPKRHSVALCIDSASIMRIMRTLYLRNVPDEVADRLKTLADREGISVSALALRELSFISRRADNAAILAGLPDLEVPRARILSAVREGRAGR